MPQTINFITTLAIETCCSCHMSFGVPRDFMERRRKDHERFFCPNGHGQNYVQRTEEEKLREELARQKSEKEKLEARLRDQMAATSKIERRSKRLAKRAAAGTCPCCRRTFPNMAKHMKTKHPDYIDGCQS